VKEIVTAIRDLDILHNIIKIGKSRRIKFENNNSNNRHLKEEESC